MSAPSPSVLLQTRSLVGEWTIDSQTSSVRLKSRSIWGLVPVKGTFREISGDGTVSPAGEIRGALRVAAASIDTNNALRDRHLRSADFFDADSHPAITYEVKSVQPSGQKVTVTGTLTVRDRALSLSFEASVAVQNDSELRIYADVRIHRADPGLTWSGLGTSMLNALTVHAVFSRR